MNQRALQKAHESNHPAVTREAVRTGGGEESRTGLASDPQALALRGPASAGRALRASSPGPRAPARPALPGQHTGRGRASAGHSPAVYTALRRRAPPSRGILREWGTDRPHTGQLREWGTATAGTWGEPCGCADTSLSLFHSTRCKEDQSRSDQLCRAGHKK